MASNGYSVFSTGYLERISNSANIALSATGGVTLDLQGDNLSLASGKSLSITAGTSTAASNITFISPGTITTNNASITLTPGSSGSIVTSSSSAVTLASNGGAITLAGPVGLGSGLAVNSGGGAVSFGGTVDGAQNLTVNSGAGGTTFSGKIGGTTPLSNLSLTGDSLTLGDKVYGTGTLTIQPSTASTNLHINDGVSSGLYLTSAEQGYIQNDWGGISIGSASSTVGLTVGASTWNSPLTLQNGSGKIEFAGAQVLGANALTAVSNSGNIQLDSGATITSTASSGNSIVLAAGGNFSNSAGATALSPGTGTARWMVYSTKASSDTNGASVMNPAQAIYNETYASEAPGSVPNSGQNTWLYSTGLITITASGQTATYGTAPNTSAVLGTTYSFSCSNGCSSSAVTGGPTLTISGSNGTSTSSNYNVGSWTITPSGVTVSNGDSISYVTGTLTVSAKSLTISGMIAAGKTYDTTNTATVNNGSDALVGKVSGDAVTLGGTGNTSGTFSSANAGTWTVTGSGLSIGGADAGNYTIAAQPTATATISPAGLTVTASNVSGTYGTSGANTLNGSTGFSSSGLLGGQTIGSVTLSTNATSSTSGNYNANTGINPASWTITPSGATGGTFNPNNYSIAYDIGTQTITPAGITISGMTASNKTYDTTTAATVNNGADVLNGVVAGHNNGGGTGDAVTLNTSSTATFSSANAGTWTVTGSGFSLSGADKGNYTLTQPALSANITPAPLSVTADNQSMTQYGSLPPLTATITGFVGGQTLTTSGVTGTAALSTPATTTSAVGSYNIAAALGTLAASNYDFTTFNSGVFTINAVPGTGGGHVLAPTPVFVAPAVQAPAPVAATPAPAPAAPIPAALSVPGTVQQETAKTANVTYALMPQPVVPTGSDVQLASYYSLMQLGAIPVTPAPTHNATPAPAGAPIAATSNGTVTETQAPDGTNNAPGPTTDNSVDEHKKKGD